MHFYVCLLANNVVFLYLRCILKDSTFKTEDNIFAIQNFKGQNSDLVKFVMCGLVSRDFVPFCKYIWNVMCTLDTKVHMTNLTRSQNSMYKSDEIKNELYNWTLKNYDHFFTSMNKDISKWHLHYFWDFPNIKIEYINLNGT